MDIYIRGLHYGVPQGATWGHFLHTLTNSEAGFLLYFLAVKLMMMFVFYGKYLHYQYQ